MAAAADPVPAVLTADGKNILDPDTKQAGFVDTKKLSSDSLLLYEKAEYECRDAFEPDLQWTTAEEKKVKRRLDARVCLWSCVMFLALNIDRGNLKQAVADNLLDDLGLTTNDYNTGENMANFGSEREI
jgi:hypothetical protein